MAWTNSKIFSAFVHDSATKTGNASLSTATAKAAVYNDAITPSQVVSAANSAYGAGVWATSQVSGTSWPAVGRPLVWGTATKLTTFADATLKFDADDTVSADASCTLTVYGVLVYDDAATTVVDQGLSYNFFGGVATVTAGTFTIVWNSSGILTLAL